MEITGIQSIAAPRESVWDALNDPETLKRCLPGCESVERTGPDEFRIVITAAIGPLRSRFKGALRMTEAAPPASCVMLFEGEGGTIGFGKGTARVNLKDVDAGTELSYSAQAQVGGKLAQVGGRLIDSVAKKMSDDFFKAFRNQFEAQASTEAPAANASPSGNASPGLSSKAEDRVAPQPIPPAEPSRHPVPVALASQVESGTRVMVPGWWLALACALGAGAALAGTWVMRTPL